jgi:6-phospho-beta-glucosidase
VTALKLAVVGGGSTYTPELVDGLARLRGRLDVDELALLDPDERRLELVGGLAARIMRRHGHPARVRPTTDVDEAVEGAGAVLFQLRVGGQAARRVDETLPLDFGCVGQETVGAGGLAKALRTVPVVRALAERVRALAPGAWLVNFTNPVGIVTRALLDDGHRAVGLCNVAIGVQRHAAALLGVAPERVTLDHAGLNHLTWVRAVRLDGADQLPALLDAHGDDLAGPSGLPVDLLRREGAVPSYYLRYYYLHDTMVARQRGAPARADEVAALERSLLELYADPSLDTKPALLERRGGAWYSEAAVQLLAALLRDTGEVQVVNVRNAGTLGFLPDDAVVEVPALVGGAGPAPAPVAPLAPGHAGLVAHVAAYEELALDAARLGGAERVAAALLAHPLVGQADLAARLADRLVAANRHHLPWAVPA